MHTLSERSDLPGKYDVVFIGKSYFSIKGECSYDEAIRLVNYLNGGAGNNFNEPVSLKDINDL